MITITIDHKRQRIRKVCGNQHFDIPYTERWIAYFREHRAKDLYENGKPKVQRTNTIPLKKQRKPCPVEGCKCLITLQADTCKTHARKPIMVSEETKAQIRQMRAAGVYWDTIKTELHVSSQTISNVMKGVK